MNVARRHHYVPEFLLRPWLVESKGQKQLHGYYWDNRKGRIVCKPRGLKSFCNQIDLLSLANHPDGRDALERIFFGDIDTCGATARDILLNVGPRGLTNDQRNDFARLLLSLEARRPAVVGLLREAERGFADKLNNDPEIVAALRKAGFTDLPSEFYERRSRIKLEDRALAIIQKLVDNPAVGGPLVKSGWTVRRLNAFSAPLLLSDRPLIRINSYDSPGAVWILPLTPSAVFIAAAHHSNLAALAALPDRQFARRLNVSTAAQAERFAFSPNPYDAAWLAKYLKPTAQNGGVSAPDEIRR
jgi:Protein of unknown function (DUF4238)